MIKVAARKSPLSQAQVKEVINECQLCLVDTVGDLDQTTSIRAMDKTNFFTKEIDEMILAGDADIAIHSAKDLPYPLPDGLEVIAITEGVDSSDSLVFKGDKLSAHPRVATSSERREQIVKQIFPDALFCDIRGTIEQRLQQITDGIVDGVVVAEAALIRLNLTHLNRITLPGETVPLQGKLAIVAKKENHEMHKHFKHLDCRKKCVLYTGLQPPELNGEIRYVHYPLIEIIPRQVDYSNFKDATHILFTSKVAVTLMSHLNLDDKVVICVGEKTAQHVLDFGGHVDSIAKDECAEGIVKILETIEEGVFFWGHSAQSRSVITDYLNKRGFTYFEKILYDTIDHNPKGEVEWSEIDEVLFTSPSTVDAFFRRFNSIPKKVQLKSIGKITQNHLNHRIDRDQNR